MLLILTNVIIICYIFLISLSNFYNGNADGVFDLGTNLERSWTFKSIHLSPRLFSNLFFEGPIVILFSPISSSRFILYWLFIQAVFLTLPSFFIYFASLKIIRQGVISLILSFTYLSSIFLPGLYYVDFHFQNFFIFFFIAGYTFFTYNRFRLSSLFLSLASSVKYPFSLFVIIFCTIEILTSIFKNYSLYGRFITQHNKESVQSNTITLMVSSLLFILGFIFVSNPVDIISKQAIATHLFIISSLLLVLISLSLYVWLPILSRKFIIFIIILSIVSLVFGDSYSFPNILYFHHTAPWITFLTLGSLDSISFLLRRNNSSLKSLRRLRRNKNSDIKRKILTLCALALFINLSFSLIYQPASPLNSKSDLNYGFEGFTLSPSKQLIYEEMLMKYVPANQTIVVQDNMPVTYPRYVGNPYSIPLVAGWSIDYPNSSQIENNKFVYAGGVTSIDWVLISESSADYANHVQNYPSMEVLSKVLLDSGFYYVFENYSNVILLKRVS